MKKLKFILSNMEEMIASAFLIITTILVVVNVFLRYVMNTGLVWSEEVATGCFVWAVFLGAAAGYKRRIHIGVDIVVNLLPQSIQAMVNIVVDLLLIAINGQITYLCVLYLQTSYKKPTPVLGISSAYISTAIFVSFVLMTIYSLYFFSKDIKQILNNRSKEVV
ncbi:MAG: TRAP transporter small permease [Angelakisella sp.]|nr:TRAP transporter small permease [Angelakisella sp.]